MNRRQFSRTLSWLAAWSAGRAFAGDAPGRVDRLGDPLPEGALCRVGTARLRERSSFMGAQALAFSPDGRVLASASFEPPVSLWDPADGSLVRRLGRAPEDSPDTGQPGVGLAFSPDGKVLAVSREGGRVERWEVATGRSLPSFDGHPGFVGGIAYASDGRTMASCDFEGVLIVRDAESGAIRLRVAAEKDPAGEFAPIVGDDPRPVLLFGVALSPDGSRLYSVGMDTRPTERDSATGRVLRAFDGPGRLELYHRRCLALSADGRSLAVGGHYCAAGVWDVESGRFRHLLSDRPDEPLGEADHDAKGVYVIDALAYSPDGRTLATGLGFGSVRLWDVADGRERARLDWREGQPQALAFSPDGRTLAAGGASGMIRVWSMPEGRERVRTSGHRSTATLLAFSPDGRSLVSVSDDAACLTDPESGRERSRKALLPRLCTSSALSKDGRLLAYQGSHSIARLTIVDVATGAEVRRFETFPEGSGTLVPEFSDDGRTLVVGSNEGERPWVALFDLATGRERKRLTPDPDDFFDRLVLAPGGRTLISLRDHTGRSAILYDVESDRVRLRIGRDDPDDPEPAPRRAAFSPDGAKLVGVDGAGVIRLWDVADGREVLRFDDELGEHGGVVAFAPDGQIVATGSSEPDSDDSTVQLWDARTGRELAFFRGHQGPIAALAFAPDGRRLASAGLDTTVLVWDVSAWR